MLPVVTTRFAVSEWSTRLMAGRSRSGNMLVPLASGGRHECYRRVCSAGRTCEDGRYGPTARAPRRRRGWSEYVDALDLGVQGTGAGAQAVSELSDFVRIGVDVLEVRVWLPDPRRVTVSVLPSLFSEPRSPTTENLSLPGGGSYAQLGQLADDLVVEADQHLSRILALHEAQPVPRQQRSGLDR